MFSPESRCELAAGAWQHLGRRAVLIGTRVSVGRISPFEPGQDLVSEWEQVVDANLFVGLSEGADQLCRDLYGYQATVTDGC